MSAERLMIATDVQFWNRSTGAEQRIAALLDFFETQSIKVRTFFVNQLEEADVACINAQNLDVVQGSSDDPPAAGTKKALWFGKAIHFRLKQYLKQIRSDDDSGPLTLDDYVWPWAVDQFGECIAEFRPDIILIEYVTLAYLLSALNSLDRKRILCMIDTHDVLHSRDQQFRQRGCAHWLSISRDEEAEALKKFDVILAIQPDEATAFREMAPDASTIVVGHSLENQISTIIPREPNEAFILGYVGSKNFSNLFAITEFVKAAAAAGLFKKSTPIELHVAGRICQWLFEELGSELDALPNIKLLGQVDDLAKFYSNVDLVINPVEFGTGLKIKNCEALAFGCPLITTTSGQAGMPSGLDKFVFVVESPVEMVSKISEIARNRDSFAKMRNEVSKVAKNVFSDKSAYSELHDILMSSKPS